MGLFDGDDERDDKHPMNWPEAWTATVFILAALIAFIVWRIT